jgi:protein SCO1/2
MTSPTDTPTSADADATDATAEPDAEPGPASRIPASATRRRAKIAALVVGVPLLVLVAGWLGLRLLRPHPYSGTVMQAPTEAPGMDGLVWSDGTPVDLGEFAGDLVLVYFGYTACPDVCPTTLSQAANAIEAMDGDSDRVHVMLVSIDPERDELEALGEYVRSFDPAFRGATGTPEAVERVASTYGIYFAADEPDGDGFYEVDHTATLMGIDGDGHLRIVWAPPIDTDRLAADLDELL